MPIPRTSLVATTLFSVVTRCVAVLFSTIGLLATGFAQDVSSLRCAQLLSADQVKTIFGAGMAAAVPKQHENGESECVWRRGNGAAAASLAVRFFDRHAIGSNPVSRTMEAITKCWSKRAKRRARKDVSS